MDAQEPEQFESEPNEPAVQSPEEPMVSQAAAARDEDESPAAEPEPVLSDEPVEEPVDAPAEEAPARPASSGRRMGVSMEGMVPSDVSAEPAWYVIHCYSGYENKVRHNLEQRI